MSAPVTVNWRNAMSVMLSLLYFVLLSARGQELPHCQETARTSSGGTISSVNYDRRSLEAHASGNCVYKVLSYTNYLQFRVTNIERTLDEQSHAACSSDACCQHLRLAVRSNHDEHILCANNITGKPPVELRGSVFEFEYTCSDIYPHAMRLTFTTSQLCKSYQYQCADMTGCYQKHEICDRFAHCIDGSDEMQCARRTCANYFVEDTFFLCKNGKCVKQLVLRNGVDDCGDGSDERFPIPKNAYFSLLLGVLFVTFMGLLLRWYMYRRDVHVIMDNLPEFPLPPFVAPGEHPTAGNADNTCPDVHIQAGAGGDIYDGYVEGMRTRTQSEHSASTKKMRDTISSSDKGAPPDLDLDDTVASQQSLSVDHTQKTHSSLVKLLYADVDIDEVEFKHPSNLRLDTQTRARAHSETIPLPTSTSRHILSRSPKSKSAGNAGPGPGAGDTKINFIETLREINNSLTLAETQKQLDATGTTTTTTNVTVHRASLEDEDYFEIASELREQSNRSKSAAAASTRSRTEYEQGLEVRLQLELEDYNPSASRHNSA